VDFYCELSNNIVVCFRNMQGFSFPFIKERNKTTLVYYMQVSVVREGTGTERPRPRRIGASKMGSKLC
jgi:hypothetical protein